MEHLDWIQIVSISIASIGAVLGVLNTSYLLFKDKVRIKVIVKRVFYTYGSEVSKEDIYSIEVINTGFIPVTINEVGFIMSRRDSRKIPLLTQPSHGTQLPSRLEPRSAITIYASERETAGIIEHGCKKAFARTDCRKLFSVKNKFHPSNM